ncbi:glycosyltransferase family 87 protein [Pandoraea fibrosis]|uniref:DUF2029 domain-containing protein n=1 Tax=Pandoraea fibrosis TaxID=1891094 RepID=A0A5E4T2S3_9BURK|nr:glycosyltransferase family 87 protein [Pandoraea fibrosis]VVD80754.1 hypothetical protein PFI31113_01098 [Pandoraea fibrosis]
MNRQAASSDLPLVSDRIGAHRAMMPRGVVLAAGVVMLAQWLALGAWAVSWLTSDGRATQGMPPLGHDLRVFWTVSWITRHVDALAAFDPATFVPTILRFFPAYPEAGYWLYPPTFQWLIQPLSWMSYPWTYAVYVIVSVAAFAMAVRQWRWWSRWPWVIAIAFPGLWVALLAGQNSLITLLLMTVALTYSGSRPLLAGLCGGLLVIKPQLAMMLPLWWLCARQWRALGAMALTAGLGCALSLAWSGWPLWQAFFAAVSRFNVEVVQRGAGGIWHAMPTVFAAARLHGATLPVAYALYALVAGLSAWLAAWLWAKRAPLPLRVAAAVMATLLAQPYLLYYELAWLIVPLMCLSILRDPADAQGHATRARLVGVQLAAVWLLPLQAYLAVLWTPMGQWGVWLLPLTMLRIATHARQWWRAHNGTHCL